MLSPQTVTEVRRLLPSVSQRRIAIMLGISRVTVGAIASGKRPDYPMAADADIDYSRPQLRCPGCGAKVYMPCRWCRLMAIIAREKAARIANRAPSDSFGA
jgi:hypothetical protein